MADYIAKTRTNYFSVKDEALFRALMDEAAEDQHDLKVMTNEGKFAFCCEGTLNGIYSPDCVDMTDAFYARLQPIIADGDACIVITAGWEKFCSVDADAVVVTNKDIKELSMSSMAIKAAAEMLGQHGWSTKLEE